MEQMTKNIYFASDFHFGYPDEVQSKEREKLVIKWLDDIKPSCKELYLLGDIFDFWFEYKYVAPQGNIRFLAKLTEFVESGIPVNIFCGNHDMWYGKYLEKEIGVSIFDEPIEREYFGKKLYIHHGHALGKYDKGMNFLNGIFTSKILRFLFAFIPVNWAYGFGRAWSRHNRTKHKNSCDSECPDHYYLGDDKEYLILHIKDVLKNNFYDYFVFGHRHVAANKEVAPNSYYVNLGNWIWGSTYAVLSENGMEVLSYKGNDKIVR